MLENQRTGYLKKIQSCLMQDHANKSRFFFRSVFRIPRHKLFDFRNQLWYAERFWHDIVLEE